MANTVFPFVQHCAAVCAPLCISLCNLAAIYQTDTNSSLSESCLVFQLCPEYVSVPKEKKLQGEGMIPKKCYYVYWLCLVHIFITSLENLATKTWENDEMWSLQTRGWEFIMQASSQGKNIVMVNISSAFHSPCSFYCRKNSIRFFFWLLRKKFFTLTKFMVKRRTKFMVKRGTKFMVKRGKTGPV